MNTTEEDREAMCDAVEYGHDLDALICKLLIDIKELIMEKICI